MALSETQARNAKPSTDGKPSKLADGRGLYLYLSPAGGKSWRLKYRLSGKEKLLVLGKYPDLSLAQARAKAEEARRQISEGIDPAAKKQEAKEAYAGQLANSFEVVCREWQTQRNVEPLQVKKSLARLQKDVFPYLGSKPIDQISAPDVLAVMKRVDDRGARFTAHKVKEEIGQTIRYAIATGRATSDPTPALKGAIPPARETNRAAILDPVKVGEMLRAFDAFAGTYPVLCALKLAPLLFVRPGELRQAKWKDIDLDKAEWRYHVNKTKTDHLVPLSRQVVAILRDLQRLTGGEQWVFPGQRTTARPMSDAAINAAIRRLGYDTKTEITGHGFRAMARTLLHEEKGIKPEVIEHQLAHSVPDVLGTAYNRTKFLKDRKEMMQVWADYLDQLKAGAEVIPFIGIKA